MAITLNPSQLLTFLGKAFARCLPILIQGAPGIGKSDLVGQAAADAGATMILSHPAVADPTDAKGLPWVVDGAATFLPFGDLQQAIDATQPTVWFLDDLGQASPAVQASYMQLLLARQVNGHRLPDCVTFVAATNRRTDRAGVSGVLEPVKSRFASIVELQPTIDDWSQWAVTHDIAPEIIGFLRFKSNLLSDFHPTADLQNSPSPRTWAHASRLLQLDLPAGILTAAIAGAVGEGAATEFMAFLKLYRELPSIDAILLSPKDAPIPQQPSTLYAVASALAMRADVANFARVSQYAQRLATEGHGEFAVLLVRDAIVKTPALGQTREYVRLVTSSDMRALMGGSSR